MEKTSELCAILSANNEAESEAITGYFALLQDVISSDVPEADLLKNDIREIISEEQKHIRILNFWIEKLSGIKPEE